MTKALENLTIEWNEDIDVDMTRTQSSDAVLAEFFRISDWAFIRCIYHCILNESDIECQGKGLLFGRDRVSLYVEDSSTTLCKREVLDAFVTLFDLLIAGANDDHHAVRYEPWWQEFTEVSYQLRSMNRLELHSEYAHV